MRCDRAEGALSALMDEPGPAPQGLEEHVRSCPRCRGFEARSWRVREAVRLELAPPVPDLVPAIMDRVREGASGGGRAGRRPGVRRALALALAAGLVAGFVLANGGLLPRSGGSSKALASQIPPALVRAAETLRGYTSTFDITERNWTAAVPLRRFVAHLSYRAPEDFRAQIADLTGYPSNQWPRNDLSMVSNGRAWRTYGPAPCPAAALPACPSGEPALREVVGRPPFDARTPMPSDLIVPMTVLAAQERVDVLGPDPVDGRAAEAVALPYQEAAPLFGSLEFLGSWRPFFPQDRVVVWLDRATWFPLKFEVYPAAGPERSLWAAQNGLPPEPPGTAVFSATVRSFSTRVPAGAVFAIPRVRGATDEGFRDATPPSSGSPGLPRSTAGLRLIRFGRFEPGPGRPAGETVAAYASGLAWLTVTRATGWAERRLFGVDAFPQRVILPGGAVGYYEPATATDPRRLALHTVAGQILVQTNLPLAALLRVAGSFPDPGLPEPASWRIDRWAGGVVEQDLAPADAVARAGFRVLVPGWLPDGYRAAAAETVSGPATGAGGSAGPATGVTLVFRRPAAELDGLGLRWYQAEGQPFPPPTGAGEEQVLVRGLVGRWSPEEHTLEWVEGGVYRSLTGPGFDLSTMLRVAAAMRGVP